MMFRHYECVLCELKLASNGSLNYHNQSKHDSDFTATNVDRTFLWKLISKTHSDGTWSRFYVCVITVIRGCVGVKAYIDIYKVSMDWMVVMWPVWSEILSKLRFARPNQIVHDTVCIIVISVTRNSESLFYIICVTCISSSSSSFLSLSFGFARRSSSTSLVVNVDRNFLDKEIWCFIWGLDITSVFNVN